VPGQGDHAGAALGDRVDHRGGVAFVDQAPWRVREAEDGLREQRRAERVDGQVEPADHRLDGYIQGAFGHGERALDRRVPAS
jgi:hypothetical protein